MSIIQTKGPDGAYILIFDPVHYDHWVKISTGNLSGCMWVQADHIKQMVKDLSALSSEIDNYRGLRPSGRCGSMASRWQQSHSLSSSSGDCGWHGRRRIV